MPTDVLPLKLARRFVPPVREAPDPAVAAVPKLTLLRDTLRAAARVVGALPESRFPAAPLFFVHPDSQANRTHETAGVDPWATVARRDPAAVRAWADLFRVAADVFPTLANSVSVRHAARAIPGLPRAAEALAPHHAAARELTEFLAVADDVTVLAIEPVAAVGMRVRVRGVSDVAQLHVLLADAMTGNPARGLLPGRRPDASVVEAYRDADPLEPPIAKARFQIYLPTALRPSGTLPRGFSGVDEWVWGHKWVSQLPAELGERVVLLGEPAFTAEWEAVRRVPTVAGELEVTGVLSPSEVRQWITNRTGKKSLPTRQIRRAA